MIEYPNALPITVVAAIAIFVAREVLEWRRRTKSDGRKLHAIRRLLAAECQKNDFAFSRLFEQVGKIQQALDCGQEFIIELRQSGMPYLVRKSGTESSSSEPIFPLNTSKIENYLFDAASLDASLFENMENALDSLAELIHVRDSFIDHISNRRIDYEGFFDSFSEYAKEEIDDAIESNRALYFKCTGEPLAVGRVR